MRFLWTLLTFLCFSITALSAQTTLTGTIQKTTAKTVLLHFYPTILG